jgi:dipeptidyl aminopeptidase/acylaminoacyl peptidase
MPSPVTVDLVLGGRTITEPRLAAGGRWLAYVVADVDGSDLAVVDVDATDSTPRRSRLDPPPAPGRGFGGGTFEWLPAASGVVYVGIDGGLWTHVLESAVTTCLRAGGDLAVTSPAVSPDGRAVAFVVDERGIVVLSLSGGEVLAEIEGPDFAFDPVFSPDSRTISFHGWSVPDMAWDGGARYTVPADGSAAPSAWRPLDGAVQQPGFLPDGREVAICDARGWNNVWVGDAPLVDEPCEHGGPTWGPRQRTWCSSPDGRAIAFTRNECGFGRLCSVDVASGEVVELGRGVHGQLSWEGARIAALRSGARTPTEVVVYELGEAAPRRRRIDRGPEAGWDDVPLAEPELVEVTHEGVTLHARRYRSTGEVNAPRLLVWVHGGPTSQWDVSFLPGAAFWASRGWDVLVVDPRGSTGHGRAYQQALHGRWGELDVDDVAALTRFAHSQQWGTPTRTAVMGGSSGGVVVLGVLGRHAGLVAAGVTAYPVSDIPDLAVHSHRFEQHYSATLIGPPGDAEADAVAVANSPQFYADRIVAPLLVLHGTADPVVPVGQSVELVGRIRAAEGPVEFHLFDGEGHGFRGPAKRSEYLLAEEFLDRCVPPDG